MIHGDADEGDVKASSGGLGGQAHHGAGATSAGHVIAAKGLVEGHAASLLSNHVRIIARWRAPS